MRVAMLIGKDASGNFIDPISGNKLDCVAEGNEVQGLVDKYLSVRDVAKGVLKKGKTEVRLTEMMLNATNTAGGMLKSKVRF